MALFWRIRRWIRKRRAEREYRKRLENIDRIVAQLRESDLEPHERVLYEGLKQFVEEHFDEEAKEVVKTYLAGLSAFILARLAHEPKLGDIVSSLEATLNVLSTLPYHMASKEPDRRVTSRIFRYVGTRFLLGRDAYKDPTTPPPPPPEEIAIRLKSLAKITQEISGYDWEDVRKLAKRMAEELKLAETEPLKVDHKSYALFAVKIPPLAWEDPKRRFLEGYEVLKRHLRSR